MGDAFPPPPSPSGSSTALPPAPIAEPDAPSTPFPPPPPAALTQPAGHVASAAGPAHTAQVSRIAGLTRWVIGLVAAAGITSVIAAVLLAPVIAKSADLLRGDIDESEFEDAFVTVQLVQGLQSAVGLAAGVVTIVWMYRISSNLRAHSRGTTFAPILVVFAWILPPFLYVLPFLVLRELWKASDPDAIHGTDEWRSSRVDPLLWIWFVVYGLIPAVITAIVFVDTVESLIGNGFSGANDPTTVAEQLDATGFYTLVSGGLAAIAAVTWIMFTKRLADRHMALTGEERS